MRYLIPALYAEGASDYRFLSPLLRRLLEDLLKNALEPVELGEMVALDHPSAVEKEDRAERIFAAAYEARSAFHLLFVHTDGAGDPLRAAHERILPAQVKINAELGNRYGTVGVVPVRETEAWALADGDALRDAFQTTLSDQDMDLPGLHEVERTLDPKQGLAATYRAVVGPRRFRKGNVERYAQMIAERVSLVRLRHLPAFVRLEHELRTVLGKLGYLAPPT